MKTLPVSQFKAQALSVLSGVARTGETVVVTKRGKPLAKVVPYAKEKGRMRPGKLAGTVLFEGDIVSPLGPELWEAAQEGGKD